MRWSRYSCKSPVQCWYGKAWPSCLPASPWVPVLVALGAVLSAPGWDRWVLSIAVVGTMDDWLWTACCLKEEGKGILRKKRMGRTFLQLLLVSALKLSALNKKLWGKKCFPEKSMSEKWAALNAMKNYSRKIVSPNHKDLQGSREQREHLGGTWHLRVLLTEVFKYKFPRHVFKAFPIQICLCVTDICPEEARIPPVSWTALVISRHSLFQRQNNNSAWNMEDSKVRYSPGIWVQPIRKIFSASAEEDASVVASGKVTGNF